MAAGLLHTADGGRQTPGKTLGFGVFELRLGSSNVYNVYFVYYSITYASKLDEKRASLRGMKRKKKERNHIAFEAIHHEVIRTIRAREERFG